MNRNTDITQVDFVQLFKRESETEKRFDKKFWIKNDKKFQQRAAEWINGFLSSPPMPEEQWAELYLRKTLYTKLVMFKRFIQDELMKELKGLKDKGGIDGGSFHNISHLIQSERGVFQSDKKRLRKEMKSLRGWRIIELWGADNTKTKDMVVEFYRANQCKRAVLFPLIDELGKVKGIEKAKMAVLFPLIDESDKVKGAERAVVSIDRVFDNAKIFKEGSLRTLYYRSKKNEQRARLLRIREQKLASRK